MTVVVIQTVSNIKIQSKQEESLREQVGPNQVKMTHQS